MALWPSVSRVNAAFLWEIIAVGELETSAAVAGQKFEFAKLHIEILLQCARKFASRQSANLTIFFPPIWIFFLPFFSSSGTRNCFQIILSAAETWCRWVSSSNSISFPVRSRHLRAICGQSEWKLNTDYYCLFLHALQVDRSPDYSNKSRARGNHTVTARTTAGVYVRAEPALMKARAHG